MRDIKDKFGGVVVMYIALILAVIPTMLIIEFTNLDKTALIVGMVNLVWVMIIFIALYQYSEYQGQ